MYFYGSKLRSQVGTLDQRCAALEVSERKIAEATGIPLTTVRNYIHGEVKEPDQSRVDRIHRDLNSREYYKGYIFMPSYDFSKFIRKEVIGVLKKKYQEDYMAKRIGMTKDKLSKMKNGKVSGIDIVEQYRILKIFYDMCRDENHYMADEFQPLHDKLRGMLGLNYSETITERFSETIDSICAQCERCKDKPTDKFHYVKIEDVKAVLDKYDLGGEIEWLRGDNNFILDNELRRRIIDDLRALYEYGTFIVYDPKLPWKFKDGFTPPQDPDLLMPSGLDNADIKDTSRVTSGEAAFNAIRDHLYKYSDTLRALIFEHIYAFIEKGDGSFRHEYEYDSLTDSYEDITPYRKKIYGTDKPLFEYKADIMKEYRGLAFDKKQDVCHELSQRINKYLGSDDIEAPYFPLRFYYLSDGTLAYDDATGWSATVSDITQLALMTERISTLRELDGTDLKLPYKVPEFNEYHIKEALAGCTAAETDTVIENIEQKLDYGSIDWNFYALLSQAEYIYAPIEHIISYIRRLKREDIGQER